MHADVEWLLEKIRDLEELSKRSRSRSAEFEVLLTAVMTLSLSDTVQDLYGNLIKTLHSVLEFEEAFILTEQEDGKSFLAEYGSGCRFAGTRWQGGPLFRRILGDRGRPAISTDIADIEEWKTLPDGDPLGVGSALYIPLIGRKKRAILVCVHSRPHFFQPRHRDICRRFVPLAAQAIVKAEDLQALWEKNEALSSTLERLRDAQDRMIVQDRLASLGSMVAGIAHEFRNPLNFVNNFAKLSCTFTDKLRRILSDAAGALDAQKLEDIWRILANIEQNLDRIASHGKRMDDIVSSMLHHSRGKRGEPVPTDLNALVRTFADLGSQAARTRHPAIDIRFDLELDPTVGKLLLVPQDLSRVIVNLVENASYAVAKKAQGAGDTAYVPQIRIRTRKLDSTIEVRVHDNGTGIAPEHRDTVFEPFFTTKRTGEGTGLGLSISHDIVVKGCGGALRLETEVGEYTELIVSLPGAQAD